MDSTVAGPILTRRAWITTVASALAAVAVTPEAANVRWAPSVVHPAIPARVFEAQLNAALAAVVAESPSHARKATARFGPLPAARGWPCAPRLVEDVVRGAVGITRG
ncbi:MAG: hypothetical protein AAGA48_06385 [Myxococcota bacterium]